MQKEKVMENKHKGVSCQSEFEKLFITTLSEKTKTDCSYLNLPSNNSFTSCVKEIKNCLKKENEGIVNSNNSLLLIKNFYDWIINDKIIKEYDYLLYSQLLQTLKSFSEGQESSKKEKYAFFEYIDKKCIHKYRKKIYEKMIYYYKNNICNIEAYYYVNTFINELLAVGTSYSYLSFIYRCYVDSMFNDFYEFLEYIFYGKNDAFDILIPMENFSENDKIIFEKKKQKVEYIDNVYYCKVYGKTIDFYFMIKENIVRIESLFNILRFYNNSKINFSFTKPISISSQYFNREFKIPISDILNYRSKRYGKNYLTNSIDVLDDLKETDKNDYHWLLNVISYAEKDQDEVNPSSYVDNWISLETLTSMSKRGQGYYAVSTIIPKMISAKLALDDIKCKFDIIKKAFKKKKIFIKNIEMFIKLTNEKTLDFDLIDDIYTKINAMDLAEMFSSLKSFKSYLNKVEYDLEIDLLRIYLLRNEYVHSSNLQAFSTMQIYKLKHILAASIDEFFRILNNRSKKNDESDFGVVFDAFSEVLFKHNIRQTAFMTLIENRRYLNVLEIHVDIDKLDIPYETLIYNMLMNNTDLFRKYEI